MTFRHLYDYYRVVLLLVMFYIFTAASVFGITLGVATVILFLVVEVVVVLLYVRRRTRSVCRAGTYVNLCMLITYKI